MKNKELKKILFVSLLGMVASIILTGCATPAASSNDNILIRRVEVNQNGFNGIPGNLHLNVEEGQEVEITFVYKDDSLPGNNPHNIASPEYGIETGTLDKNNPEITLRFTANETGEVIFYCITPECIGHHNLHGEDEHDDDEHEDDDDHGDDEHEDDEHDDDDGH